MLDLVAKLKGLRGESATEFKLTFTIPQPISQESLPDFGKLRRPTLTITVAPPLETAVLEDPEPKFHGSLRGADFLPRP
jgi:hypothetical protein